VCVCVCVCVCVAQDVPSAAAEFAHPEVQIGLTVMAFRYEGLRRRDLHAVVTSLKKALTHESGPFTERPSRVLFDSWLAAAWADRATAELRAGGGVSSGAAVAAVAAAARSRAAAAAGDEDQLTSGFGILPLEMFQPDDEKQLRSAHYALGRSPEVVLYFLSNFVFPSVMNHQELKLTASGCDLGGDMLFHARAGFSGTPSDLLPREFLPCMVESGSDAEMVRLLGNRAFVAHTIVESWTVPALLKWVAAHEPPFHALIDRGALITGLENHEVAAALLRLGLRGMDACVFLDEKDQKMVLVRGGGRVPLAQCGVPLERRFTFYDQIHTVGMDIKQTLDATAAVTLGKDMTLRDYAQACWRMRGIGKGQTVHLYIVGEVCERALWHARHRVMLSYVSVRARAADAADTASLGDWGGRARRARVALRELDGVRQAAVPAAVHAEHDKHLAQGARVRARIC
jgi:hypothetical protein